MLLDNYLIIHPGILIKLKGSLKLYQISMKLMIYYRVMKKEKASRFTNHVRKEIIDKP